MRRANVLLRNETVNVRSGWYGLVLAIAVLSAPLVVQAERPVGPQLLPDTTLAMVRVADTPDLVERFRETAIGRIGQDEKVKPLVSQLYATLQEAWGQIEERVGLPLDEILRIPQGEICAAFVAVPDQRPGVVVLIDVHNRLPQIERMLERGEEFLEQNGGTIGTEKIGDQTIAHYTTPDGQQVYLLKRDGTIAAMTSKPLAEFVVSAWDGKAENTLADKDEYNAIASRCGAGSDDPPQVTYYVDPIEIVRTMTRGSAAGTFLALIPVLGLDGVLGVGGSMTFATGEFDEVQHMHLLLDNPRAGVVEALAMKSGDSTPERWVPADVVSYTTLHWDGKQTFKVAAKLYNSLMEEGAFEGEVRRRVSDRLGVDFEQDVLPGLDGRVTYVQWVEKPVRINSIVNLVGLKLKDGKAFQQVFDKVRQKHAERLKEQRFGSNIYWTIETPRRRVPEEANLRQPTPCVAIVDNYLLLSDSRDALQHALTTASDINAGLAKELDFKLIASKIKRQPGGDAPGMVQFSRPEEGLRFWYDMAMSEQTQRGLGRAAENNDFFRSVDQALKDNPLPPFSVLAQYMAPGGGMMVNDETGLHYTTFTLKRK
jgi:hypothetical protein